MFVTNFVREFRQQYATAKPITRATFVALFTGTACTYVGQSVMAYPTVIDGITLAILGAFFGYAAHLAGQFLARMPEAEDAENEVVQINQAVPEVIVMPVPPAIATSEGEGQRQAA